MEASIYVKSDVSKLYRGLYPWGNTQAAIENNESRLCIPKHQGCFDGDARCFLFQTGGLLFHFEKKTVVYINICRIEDTSLEHLEGRN